MPVVLFEIALACMAAGAAAVGLVNPGAGPFWFSLGALFGLASLLVWVRSRREPEPATTQPSTRYVMVDKAQATDAIARVLDAINGAPTALREPHNTRWKQVRNGLLGSGQPLLLDLNGADPFRMSAQRAQVMRRRAEVWLDDYWRERIKAWTTPAQAAEQIASAFEAVAAPGDWRRGLLGQVESAVYWLERHP